MSPALAAWRQACQAWVHRGHTIFYREGGTHPRSDTALLLIHGFPTASWDWHALWDTLCAKFPRVIAADMIGFGFSDKPASYDYSIFDQADLHQNLLRHLGIARCDILAHDCGDTVAQELLARHVERKASGDPSLRIDSCALLNGGLFPEAYRVRPIQKLMVGPLGTLLSLVISRRTFTRNLAAIFGPNTQPSATEMEDFWLLHRNNNGNRATPRILRYMHERKTHRERWVGALQRTRVPLRFINGLADPVSGAHMVARYRELIPNPDVVELPGIGHYPQVEDSAGVLRAFLEFHERL